MGESKAGWGYFPGLETKRGPQGPRERVGPAFLGPLFGKRVQLSFQGYLKVREI